MEGNIAKYWQVEITALELREGRKRLRRQLLAGREGRMTPGDNNYEIGREGMLTAGDNSRGIETRENESTTQEIADRRLGGRGE